MATDLQNHGRRADSERPLRLEAMGDDVAAPIKYPGLSDADVVGYSMGSGTAFQAAIQRS